MKIAIKDAKQLLKRTRKAVKKSTYFNDMSKEYMLDLISHISPNNFSSSDADMLESIFLNAG